jgi:hypothetical protein
MVRGQVLSVWIGAAPQGLATMQVVTRTSDGERQVTRRRGPEAVMRDLVRTMAQDHDLVPIWDEGPAANGVLRPPAPFWTTRDLAPAHTDQVAS